MSTQLFCFASAGGSVSMYNELEKNLASNINMMPIELPGRGRRFSEPLKNSMEEVVEDCYQQVITKIDGTYALLGYSMGAWIAYELYYRLKNRGIDPPCHLFICAQEPPFIEQNPEDNLHELPDKLFLQRIIDLGGIPKDLRSPEILSFFLPILRSDYTIVETYNGRLKNNKIDCDVSVIYSDEDSVLCKDPNNPFMWRECVHGKTNFFNLKGGHFFINHSTDNMVEIINQQINKYDDNQGEVV